MFKINYVYCSKGPMGGLRVLLSAIIIYDKIIKYYANNKREESVSLSYKIQYVNWGLIIKDHQARRNGERNVFTELCVRY